MSRYAVEKRIAVAVRDKECQCRVSVSAGANDNRFIHVRRCSPGHVSQIKELTRRAEHELNEMNAAPSGK